jgi:cholesterol oxidase
MQTDRDYDFVVVGSGFGGSVSALRLAEKGYRVAVLEAGWRFLPGKFPKTDWNIFRYFFWPTLGCHGVQRINFLKHGGMILTGAGVGGGSLVYANTLLVPPEKFFRAPAWTELDADWSKTLAPFLAVAKKMLGVATNPKLWRADEALRDYAKELGREASFGPTEVGVFFGEPGVQVPDPYFNGEGPPRIGCAHTGHCMLGCNSGGKNSLDRNYLYLAEKKGAAVFPNTTVTDIIPKAGGGYSVVSRCTAGLIGHPKSTWTARAVIVAAGALATNRLLLRCRDRGHLANLSPRLGTMVRTNSEVVNAAMAVKTDYDFSRGVAITSGAFVDDVTHVESVRYPKGSGLMLGFGTLMASGGPWRRLRWLVACLTHPVNFLRTLWPFKRGERTIVCLVMQTLDNHLELHWKRRWWWPFAKGLTSKQAGSQPPTFITAGDETAKAVARRVGGIPLNTLTEVLFNMPTTGHFLGGCIMGKDAEHGVVDKYHRVYGYDDLYIVDGSTIPANLGVNPSLTITAMAEHAMSQIPEKAVRSA